MSYLNQFFALTVSFYKAGVLIATRRKVNFSAVFTVVDNPSLDAVDVGVNVTAAGEVDPDPNTIVLRDGAGQARATSFAPASSGVATTGLLRGTKFASVVFAGLDAATGLVNLPYLATDGADGVTLGGTLAAAVRLAAGANPSLLLDGATQSLFVETGAHGALYVDSTEASLAADSALLAAAPGTLTPIPSAGQAIVHGSSGAQLNYNLSSEITIDVAGAKIKLAGTKRLHVDAANTRLELGYGSAVFESTVIPFITQLQLGGTGSNPGNPFGIIGQQGQNVAAGYNNDGAPIAVWAGLPGTGGLSGYRGDISILGGRLELRAFGSASSPTGTTLIKSGSTIRVQVDDQLRVNGPVTLAETAEPVAGAAGEYTFWSDPDGNLYVKDSADVSTQIAPAASTGGGPTPIPFVCGAQSTTQTGYQEIGRRTFDPSTWSATGRTIVLVMDGEVAVAGQTLSVELYNITDAASVVVLTSTSTTGDEQESATLAVPADLPNSKKTYSLRIKRTGGTATDQVTCKNAYLEVRY